MTYGDLDSTAPFRLQHLEGLTIVRLRRDVDAATREQVTQVLDDCTGAVVLDLADHVVADTELAPLVEALRTLASRGGAVMVVSSRASGRDALRAQGFADVHESLDSAVGALGAPILRQEEHHEAGLSPAASDSQTVAAEDLLGGSGRPTP